MTTSNQFSPEYLPEGYMDDLRYVIEVKDEFGWIDNAMFDDLGEARKEAQALTKNFSNDSVRLIGRQEAAELLIF